MKMRATDRRDAACNHTDMGKAEYLVELAAQKAVEQGAVVEMVTGHKGLADSGGIGAFLRF